uniref:Pentacotripeptide-repeat region of PRORP domain-containing protein n=1 Tax=Coccolithus braarudii TaxID=221442 RepID=A0A7S0Q162_9EUKA
MITGLRSTSPVAKSPGDDLKQLEAQMISLLRAGDHDGLVSLRDKPNMNLHMINMVLTAEMAPANASIEGAAVRMFELSAKHGLTPNTPIHHNVLCALSRRGGPPEAVLSWIARMRASNIMDTFTCNVELKTHTGMGNIDAATTLLSSMMRGESNVPSPDSVSFNTVLAALADTREPEKAERMIATIYDSGLGALMDSHSFTSVIHSFAKTSRPDKAAHWLGRMLEANIRPDVVTFNAVLAAHAHCGDIEGSKRVLRAFDDYAVAECPNVRPDVISYNTLISACSKAGDPAEAEAAFEAMSAAGISPDHVSFTSVISAHARSGSPSSAQKWLERMQHSPGVAPPDAVTWNTLCSAHARVGDSVAAVGCFRAMEVAGIRPSGRTHAIMINAFVQANELSRANASIRELVALNEPLTASSFNALISAYARNKAADTAESIFTLMLQARVAPTIVTYNALASAHAARHDLTKVERTLTLAAQQLGAAALDRFSYGALLLACVRSEAPAAVSRRHVRALLSSKVKLNDYLRSLCARAVGESVLQALLSKRDAEPPTPSRERPITRQFGAATTPPTRVACTTSAAWSPVPAPPCASTPVDVPVLIKKITAASSPNLVENITPINGESQAAEDGWVTVTTNRKKGKARGGRQHQAHRVSDPPAPSGAIAKPRQPQPKTSTAVAASPPAHSMVLRLNSPSKPMVRLTGITRSKSAHAGLLSLASTVALDAALNTNELKLSTIPLKRSAASELAITLASDMRL